MTMPTKYNSDIRAIGRLSTAGYIGPFVDLPAVAGMSSIVTDYHYTPPIDYRIEIVEVLPAGAVRIAARRMDGVTDDDDAAWNPLEVSVRKDNRADGAKWPHENYMNPMRMADVISTALRRALITRTIQPDIDLRLALESVSAAVTSLPCHSATPVDW